jgi:hypothetical protein
MSDRVACRIWDLITSASEVQYFVASRLLSKNVKNRIHKTIILLVVLYGYETWSLTLREEPRSRVSENRELREMFGPRREVITAGRTVKCM